MDIFATIESHDLDLLAKMLSNNVDLNCLRSDSLAWTPLHEAIEQLEDGGSIDALVLLLRHGASIDIWDGNHDSTPLLMALFRGHLEVVRLLLAAGADPNVVGSEGDSPLRWCIERGDHDTAALLLRCGATRTIDSFGGPTGMTALGQAAYRLDLKMIEILLNAGADPEALDADRFTAARRMPPTDETKHNTTKLAIEALLVRSPLL
jgi:uncharacterized protein